MRPPGVGLGPTAGGPWEIGTGSVTNKRTEAAAQLCPDLRGTLRCCGPCCPRLSSIFGKLYDVACSACYAGQLAVLELAVRGGLILGVHSRILILGVRSRVL